MPHTVIDLLLSNPLTTVAMAEGMAAAIMKDRIDQNTELGQAFTRIYNLVKDTEFVAVDEGLLKEAAEKELFEQASAAYEASRTALEEEDYVKLVGTPDSLVPAINQFFDAVMVMYKDEAIKQNLLQLLRLTYETMAVIGDVSTLK